MEDGKIAVVWKSAFAPSGWAFAIWGIIYLGELLTTLYIAFAPSGWNGDHTAITKVMKKPGAFFGAYLATTEVVDPGAPCGFLEGVKRASIFWAAGNLFQVNFS